MITAITAMPDGAFSTPASVISAGATVLEPLGTLFLNMMFCIVVRAILSTASRVKKP